MAQANPLESGIRKRSLEIYQQQDERRKEPGKLQERIQAECGHPTAIEQADRTRRMCVVCGLETTKEERFGKLENSFLVTWMKSAVSFSRLRRPLKLLPLPIDLPTIGTPEG